MPAGIVIVLVNEPVLRVAVCPEVGVTVVVSTLNTSIVLAGKPEPEIVTEYPAAPETELNTIVGLPPVTVKVVYVMILVAEVALLQI